MLEVYLLAFLLLIHSSLLFCKPNECVFDATPVLKVIPPSIVAVITKILNIIPISIPSLQLIAHFLLVGDIIYLLTLICNAFGRIFRFFLGIIMMALTICFIIYILSMASDNPQLTSIR